VKTVSDKVVGHSLAYLTVWKWLMGDVPCYVKIWPTSGKTQIFNLFSPIVPQP